MKVLFLNFLLYITCHAFAAETDFIVFTQPHTGSHLLVPILEELTGLEGIWPSKYFTPDFPCDEETFELLSEDPDYLAYIWHRRPVIKSQFFKALDKTKKQKQFIFLHAPYTENMERVLIEKGYRVFTIGRDPRDTCISSVLHCRKFRTGLINGSWYHDLPFDEQLELMITGTDWTNSIRHLTLAFKGWQLSPICCRVSFAKLLGPMGGAATEEELIEELQKIARFIDLEVSDKVLLDIFYRVYGTGFTFHKGHVGMWKEYFNEEHKRIFDEEMKDIMEEFPCTNT